MSLLFCAAAVTALAVSPAPQNSGKKVRATPSELAAKAGSAVAWRPDLASAQEEAKVSGKPVFWYVPTIHRSPMDRRVEIDRYMMAGPFSWPLMAEFLNEHFIPVRMKAGKAECGSFGLAQLRFVEPGWLVLDQDGNEIAREHQITTFHPTRFAAPLATVCNQPNPMPAARIGATDDKAVALWVKGARAWWGSDESSAHEHWQNLCAQYPNHPIAWKAAMELEGLGPFVHAFETYSPLSEAALQPNTTGTVCQPGLYTQDQLWQSGVEFLLATQRSHGGWEDSTYDFGGTDSLPNVYVAISSICAIGLLEYTERLEQPDPRVEKALELAFAYVTDKNHLNLEDTDEVFWAHLYRTRLLTRWLELRPHQAKHLRPPLEEAVNNLASAQGRKGAWAHEYANPFVTADALIALALAKRQGITPGKLPAVSEQGLSSLLLCRTPKGAYSYDQARPGKARAAVQGSVGRTPRGELAFHLWSSRDAWGLEKAVALSFEHEGHLLPARKYDDHTRSYAYGGFFFFYDLLARSEAIASLQEGPFKQESIQRQRRQLTDLPEFDGVFVDSHEIGRSYGTAMALWCLAILENKPG